MDLKDMGEYITAWKNGEKLPKKNVLLILFLLGALLFVVVLPVGRSEKKGTNDGKAVEMIPESENGRIGDYESYMEQKTANILSEVNGAGEVTVMVTLKSNGQKLIEKDHFGNTQSTEEAVGDQKRKSEDTSSEKVSVYEQTSDGASVPYVSKELTPEVEGVIVIADGGDNAVVAQNLTEAVQALFGVEAHKIKIMKRG